MHPALVIAGGYDPRVSEIVILGTSDGEEMATGVTDVSVSTIDTAQLPGAHLAPLETDYTEAGPFALVSPIDELPALPTEITEEPRESVVAPSPRCE